jgi:hypothetical protein
MFKLVALVIIAAQPEPLMLEGATRFPTQAQCEAKIAEATEQLARQLWVTSQLGTPSAAAARVRRAKASVGGRVLAQWEWAGTTSIVAPDRNAGGGATLCLEATIQQAMARKPDTETYA